MSFYLEEQYPMVLKAFKSLEALIEEEESSQIQLSFESLSSQTSDFLAEVEEIIDSPDYGPGIDDEPVIVYAPDTPKRKPATFKTGPFKKVRFMSDITFHDAVDEYEIGEEYDIENEFDSVFFDDLVYDSDVENALMETEKILDLINEIK
jgi:hypothetical protein